MRLCMTRVAPPPYSETVYQSLLTDSAMGQSCVDISLSLSGQPFLLHSLVREVFAVLWQLLF